MKHPSKTNRELLEEIIILKRRIQELEQSKLVCGHIEETGKESDRRFRSLMEATNDCIWEIRTDGHFTYVSPKIKNLLGYESEDIIGKTLFEFLTKDEAERIGQLFKNISELRQSFSGLESASLHRDGRKIIFETSGVPVIDAKGNLVGYRGFTRDITERKKIEDTLRTSQLRLSEAMNLAHIVYWEFDLKDNVFIFNDPFYAFYGTNAEKEGGYRMSREEYAKRFVHPDDRQFFFQIIEQNNAAEGPEYSTDVEHRIIRRNDNEVRYTLTRIRIIFDDTGHIIKRFGANQDITDLKLVIEACKASEEKYRNVIENSLIGFYILKNKLFRYVNRQFCEIMGYTYEEIVDKLGPLDLVYPDDRDMMAENIRRRKNGETDRVEYNFRGIRKDSQVINIKIIGTTMTYEGERVITGTILDVTREQKLENQLRQSQKMEAIGTLAGGIAHDFNNIITVLMGYASLILSKMNTSDPLRSYMDQILFASQKAVDLTHSLLTFSRQQPVTLVPLNINNAIKAAEKLLTRLLTEDIELRMFLTGEDTIVMADKSQIDQILFNLVANARDSMPKGGVLAIGTVITVITDTFIKTHGFGEAGKYAEITVSDTGMGMDETTKEKIFDPFFTTKEVGKGTGLGLATVYGIVNQHKGYITVQSTPNQGTTFHIYLPATKKMEVVEKKDTVVSINRGKEIILIAEDNEDVRRFMREALKAHGYIIIEAVDGEDAVEKFKRHRDIDLIIIDSVMPKKNGRETYKDIHSIDPDVKVLFTSGYTRDVILDKGIEEKELDFIAKPLLLNELLQKVREVLDR